MTIEEIEKICQRATPGPWFIQSSNPMYTVHPIVRALCAYNEDGYPEAFPNLDKQDADFIVMAQRYLPKLLAIAAAAKDLCNKITLQPGDTWEIEAYLKELES